MYKFKRIAIENQNTLFKFLLVLIGFLFFFVIGREHGYVLQRDSEAYLEDGISVGVMPIYPLFLRGLKFLFGDPFFLYAAMIIQGIFAILCSSLLASFLAERFQLKKGQFLIVYVLSFLPYAYSLPQNVVSHEIMTESISFSVFYIYFILLADGILERNSKKLHISCFALLILLGLRKQFLFLLAVSLIVYIWYFLKVGIISKRLLTLISLSVVVLTAILILAANLSPKLLDVFDKSQIIDALIGKTIYVSDETDVELFETEDLKGAFQTLYEYADQDKKLHKYTDEYEGEKWIHITEGMNYTTANCWRNLYHYSLEENIEYEYVEEMQTDVMFILFMHHWLDLLVVFVELAMQSLISAIFIKKAEWYAICQTITCMIYFGAFVLRWICKKKFAQERKIYEIFDLTMIILLSNVFILNLFFMGLQRYVVYTFGLFYIALFIMFIKIWENKEIFRRI